MTKIRRLKKFIMIMFLLGICMFNLMACSKQQEEEVGTEVIEAPEEKSALELEIEQYEIKLSAGKFTTEDYYALADLYEEAGYYLKKRNLLEQCVRLNGDDKSLELLGDITINLAEESVDVQNMITEVLSCADTEEGYDVVLRTIKGEEWFSVLMPKLKSGSRKYYTKLSDSATAYIEVGYIGENAYSKVWLMDVDNVKAILWQDGTYRILSCGYEDGEYEGLFELWTLDEQSKAVIHEIGTLQKGVPTGDYTARSCSMEDTTDAAGFWLSKDDYTYTTYSGKFDESGVPMIEQPDEKNQNNLLADTGFSSCMVYAYDENKKTCLWIGDAKNLTANLLGIQEIPTFDTYEVAVKEASQDETPQIRVYDGIVQWFDGTKWVDVETVAQMEQEDPFANSNIQILESAQNVAATEQPAANRNVGSIVEEKAASSNGTKKNSSDKKTSTISKTETNQAAPAETAAQTPASATPSADASSNQVADNNSRGEDAATPTPSTSSTPSEPSAPTEPSTPTAPSEPSDGDNNSSESSSGGESNSGDGEMVWGWGADILD